MEQNVTLQACNSQGPLERARNSAPPPPVFWEMRKLPQLAQGADDGKNPED